MKTHSSIDDGTTPQITRVITRIVVVVVVVVVVVIKNKRQKGKICSRPTNSYVYIQRVAATLNYYCCCTRLQLLPLCMRFTYTAAAARHCTAACSIQQCTWHVHTRTRQCVRTATHVFSPRLKKEKISSKRNTDSHAEPFITYLVISRGILAASFSSINHFTALAIFGLVIRTPSPGRYGPSRDRTRQPPTSLSQRDSSLAALSALARTLQSWIWRLRRLINVESLVRISLCGRKCKLISLLYINTRRTLCAGIVLGLLCVPPPIGTPASTTLARSIRAKPRRHSAAPTSRSRGNSSPTGRSTLAGSLRLWSRRLRRFIDSEEYGLWRLGTILSQIHGSSTDT